eukprot:scpid33236/ scgid4028/ RNA-directed DNA polymerase from mobile element jockey; Reverse transcriptase
MHSGTKTVLGALYRPGSCAETDTSLMDYLDNTLDDVRRLGSNVIIAGDFNVHNSAWLQSSKTTRAGECLEEVCAAHHLVQHVTQPTRGNNTLDLIISDFSHPVCTTAYAPLGRSDHAVIIAEFLQQHPRREDPAVRQVWKYALADWHRLRAYLRNIDWPAKIHGCAEQSCQRVTDVIMHGMKQFIPSKELVVHQSNPVWWTPDCSNANHAKERAWKLWRRNPRNDNHKVQYITTVNHEVEACHAARLAHQRRIRNKLTAGSLRDKEWWSTIKSAAGKGRCSDIPLLTNPAGQEFHSSREKAECFAAHFANKCSLGNNDLCAADLPDLQRPAYATLKHIHFRAATVKRHLANLAVSKATGPDGISARVLKMCSSELADPLAKLFALCFLAGVQPGAWKLAHVVPVHKRSSRSLASNYRPISLLTIMSKVMEGIVNTQLVNYLEKHEVLPNSQFGFRRGRGTADILTALQHEWVHTISTGGCVQVLAVDIAGAFDRVSHTGVLYKAKQAGVDGRLLVWLQDYLTNRNIRVVVGGQTSDAQPIQAGVPQGSILGPSLFLLYTCDIEQCLTPGTQLSSFADDTTLYSLVQPTDDLQQSTASLQGSLNSLEEWGRKWRICFEPAKTQRMTLHRKHVPPCTPPVTFGGEALQETDTLKLLGVMLDPTLSYRAHTRSVALRASQRLGFLRKAAPILDDHGRVTVYKGFVRPLLEYAPLAWSSAAATNMAQLDKVQQRALHFLGPGTILQSLQLRRMVAALSYLFKLHYIPGPPQVKAMLPPTKPPAVASMCTRQKRQTHHAFQLKWTPPRTAPDYLLRSFPFFAITPWNNLPADLLLHEPHSRRLQTFKVNVCKDLIRKRWLWSTQYL